MRAAAAFVAVCMVLIAGSAGTVAFFYLGLSVAESIMLAIAVLTALALYNAVSARLGQRSAVGHQLTDLSRGGADLARQVAELARRLSAMETRVEAAVDRTHAVTDPLTIEIGELGTLVNQLAETVNAHELRLVALARPEAAPPSVVGEAPIAAPAVAPAPVEPAAAAAASETPPAAAAPAPTTPPSTALAATPLSPEIKPASVAPSKAPEPAVPLAEISAAVEANRIDLYLQPVVTLPQRKVRYYEALARMRSEAGDVLPAADFLPQAEDGGLMPKIDNLMIFRCVQVVRRLLLKNRDVGLFCNVSGATLTDSTVFPQFLEFMEANRAIAPSLVLEFTQAAVRAMGPIEHESLAALAERGFRFSLDNLTDLRFEPRELADRSFRFIKIPAGLLLNRNNVAVSDIHPADLADLLGRFGIDLVAEKIETEANVVDLLDYDLKYGQGLLFSAPRPVRPEALQGSPERVETITREIGALDERPTTLGAAVLGQRSEPTTTQSGKIERTSALAQLARGVVSRS
jgi:cyclic-di-GMP phosphodiesterase TipF (flagellum assembly factor)